MPPPPNFDEIVAQWRLPGLMEAEQAVARKWLDAQGRNYDRIDFNVPLGPKVDFPMELDADQRAQMDFLYATKADIVAYLDADATIIEVKRRLTKGAIGQLAHYVYWFRKQHPEIRTVITRAIAAYADAGIAESTLANGIDIELYGDV